MSTLTGLVEYIMTDQLTFSAMWNLLKITDGGYVWDPERTWSVAQVELALSRIVASIYWRGELASLFYLSSRLLIAVCSELPKNVPVPE